MYEPFLSPKANATFDAFPNDIQEVVSDRILKICKSPTKNSRRACFPYAHNGHVSILQIPAADGDKEVVSIHFRFGQDEISIEIFAFGRYTLSAIVDEDDDPD